jgi:hypothetical protein
MINRVLPILYAIASIALTAWVFSRRIRHSEPIAQVFAAVAAGFLILLCFLVLNRRRTVGWAFTVFSVVGFPMTFALILSALFVLERYCGW